jgi:hypothetical protein
VDGSNVLHPYAQQRGIYNPFYVIPDAGHTSYSLDFFGTVVQPFFDSTVYYMKNFFAYQLGCNATPTLISNNTSQQTELFPNPASDEFYLKGARSLAGQLISITDISGKEVYKSVFSGAPVSTQSVGLTKGMYIVSLTDQKTMEISVAKLMIE